MTWHQLTIPFDDWDTVESSALARLEPGITAVERAALIDQWFFTRKAEPATPTSCEPTQMRPCWRVRLHSPEPTAADEAVALLNTYLPTPSPPSIYEAEEIAFGGDRGMAVAHTLFHQDSRHVLTYLSTTEANAPTAGRSELALLLCSRLFRAARQDLFEQGEIWARVAAHRQSADFPSAPAASLRSSVHRLMTVDTRDPRANVAFAADWLAALDDAGSHLAHLAREGQLQRGLRAVLAHHALFLFNRWGLHGSTQAALAHTAAAVVFD